MASYALYHFCNLVPLLGKHGVWLKQFRWKRELSFTTQKANPCVKCNLWIGSVCSAHVGLPDVFKKFEFIVTILKSGDFTNISGLLTSREQSGDLGWWACVLAQGQQAGAECWSWFSASIMSSWREDRINYHLPFSLSGSFPSSWKESKGT